MLTVLHKILEPFLLRRLKTDVKLDIPPKREVCSKKLGGWITGTQMDTNRHNPIARQADRLAYRQAGRDISADRQT